MKIADILLLDYAAEIDHTRRTLERIPDNPAWKPHDKSMPIGRLAMHCATIPLFGLYIVEDEGMDMAAPKRPHMSLDWQGTEHALATLDDAAEKCRAALTAASDDHLMKPWRFSFGAQLIGDAPRAVMFRNLFFDHMIHHVSQLGVYLRLVNIPVPALYGPSADEQWAPK